MPLVRNSRSYDEKKATTVRLEEKLRNKLYDEAKEKRVTMAKLINEILRRHYEGDN